MEDPEDNASLAHRARIWQKHADESGEFRQQMEALHRC
jgi:hypothetical protein